MIQEAIKKLKNKNDLTEKETYESMKEIMEGEVTPAQIASFLTSLSMKGETVEEIYSCAKLMREKAVNINPPESAVDTCGTGGDGKGTFNVSTISSFVIAGAEVPVAKHGNRSVSSNSGSADLMEELDIKINLKPAKIEKCMEEIGFGFMYALIFHKAMKHANDVRKQLGIRTIFNLLGPLTNPGSVDYQLLGVYDKDLTEPFAEVLKKFNLKHALVVHGFGLDELSLTGVNHISELKDGKITNYTISPQSLGFEKISIQEIKSKGIKHNSEIALSVLKGDQSPFYDMVLLNSGAALYVSEKVDNIQEGIKLAEESIQSGKAEEKLQAIMDYTKKLGD